MTIKELESCEDAFLLALGTALLGLGSCTNAPLFAKSTDTFPAPTVKKCTQQKIPMAELYQMTNSVQSVRGE